MVAVFSELGNTKLNGNKKGVGWVLCVLFVEGAHSPETKGNVSSMLVRLVFRITRGCGIDHGGGAQCHQEPSSRCSLLCLNINKNIVKALHVKAKACVLVASKCNWWCLVAVQTVYASLHL